ncbi:hypothetical protein [Arthrobacter sp. EPSL27]|uniref:hypothetical protein n=1 Tax=Arthrobacter sp. EPSL27 TaxID=1745378 RepID=UPI00074992D6|nr:hypothetical protein [Arthrobacter sp. EPSL27]KUM37371.1 hypothetical protein AR539_08860 [Arthrobacter sp. EPSL27]
MLTLTRARPALFISEVGLLFLALVLIGIALINSAAAVAAFPVEPLAFLGSLIFLGAGAGCTVVSLCALSGRPRSVIARAVWMCAGWAAAVYPLSLALTHLAGTYAAALPVAGAGILLAVLPVGKEKHYGPRDRGCESIRS